MLTNEFLRRSKEIQEALDIGDCKKTWQNMRGKKKRAALTVIWRTNTHARSTTVAAQMKP